MIKEFKPFPRQEDFLRIPDTVFEALYGGAAGGGKSDCLLMLPIVRGFYKHPRFKGIIFRRTFPELEAELIVRSHDWYPHTGARYVSDKKRWVFPSGAIMQFGHVEYEADVRKYDSAEYNYMAFDELTSFTEYQYTYLGITRTRSSSDLPAIVRAGTNPGNIGHTWVKRRFIDPAPQKTIIIDKKIGTKRIFIQSLVTDNPYIEKDYALRLEMLPEAERRAKLKGEWDSFEGQVFDDWRSANIPGEPENALHVIPSFKVPEWWTRVLAIDWGFTAKTVALWGAVSPQDRLYIYREFSCEKTRIIDWATEVKNRSRGEHYEEVVMCQSAWQDRGDELMIYQQFEKYSGLKVSKANNDRIAGKVNLQEYMRWKPKLLSKEIIGEYDSETAAQLLRRFGMERYRQYMMSFEPEEPETNLPKLQVFEECEGFKDVIPRCIYSPKDRVTQKPSEDVMEFVGDDFYDTGRYLCLIADHHTQRTSVEAERRLKFDKIVNDLQANNNQTSFYRKMEFAEATSKRNSGPIPLRKLGNYGRRR